MTKTESLLLRLNAEELARVHAMAGARGLNAQAFLRSLIAEAARGCVFGARATALDGLERFARWALLDEAMALPAEPGRALLYFLIGGCEHVFRTEAGACRLCGDVAGSSKAPSIHVRSRSTSEKKTKTKVRKR